MSANNDAQGRVVGERLRAHAPITALRSGSLKRRLRLDPVLLSFRRSGRRMTSHSPVHATATGPDLVLPDATAGYPTFDSVGTTSLVTG